MNKCYVCEDEMKKNEAMSVGNIYLCPECFSDHMAYGGGRDGNVEA